jgi:hypothetical protein
VGSLLKRGGEEIVEIKVILCKLINKEDDELGTLALAGIIRIGMMMMEGYKLHLSLGVGE